ncbi:MAG TPA: outer membrane beta-barrel protein [Xanthobacteraceae bacterium]
MRRAFDIVIAAAMLTTPLVAEAADIVPYKAPAPATKFLPPTYDWTGFYIGVQGGYGWGDSSGTQNAGGTFFPVVPYTISPHGFVGGGRGGFNFQTRSLVVGVEADLEAANLSGLSALSAFGQTYFFNVTADTLASVRGRAGFAHDRWLVYGTGGVAWGHVTTPPLDTLNGWRTGWTVGAGIEHALFKDWTASLEYRFTDLGRASHFDPTLNSTDDNTLSFHAVRAGVSHKLGIN